MKSNNLPMIQASLLVALSGVLYGLMGFLGSKIIAENIDISSMLFWRFFIAGLWMIPFIVKNKAHHALFKIDKRQLWFVLLLGPLAYAGGSGFYFMACAHMGTGLSMVIFFSYPIIIAFFAWLTQKYQVNFSTFFLFLCMSIGFFLLRDASDNPINLVGVLFSFAAAGSYALYIVGSKKYSSHVIDSNILTMLISFGSAFIFMILSLSKGSIAMPQSPKTWTYLLSLGILVTALPIQLMLEGLKKISSMRASIISVLEPIVTVFVGILLLNESLSLTQFIGIIIILGSAIMVQFQREL